MTTNNIVSTPNITGNVGSCTSNTISTVSGRDGIFTQQVVNTITNSCTGQIKEYNTWEFTGVSIAIIVTVIMMTFAFLIGIADNY